MDQRRSPHNRLPPFPPRIEFDPQTLWQQRPWAIGGPEATCKETYDGIGYGGG
ncbi:hypothetical protein LTR16_006029, partial [Cryomyces antarcticus]